MIQALTLYVGGTIAVLNLFVFLIARFYQRVACQPTRDWLFLVSLGLLLASCLVYVWQGPPLVGNPLGDLLMFAGGGVLIGNGQLLLRAMTRGH